VATGPNHFLNKKIKIQCKIKKMGEKSSKEENIKNTLKIINREK
jgi:hypothetical protein